MNRWNRIVSLVLQQAKGVKQKGSLVEMWMELTDRYGNRYYFNEKSKVWEVKKAIRKITEVNMV